MRFRRGWMLGDGTGCGKGRQVAAIVLDQWLRGRRRALWLSHSDKLIEDARRDWTAIGGRAEDIVPISKFRQGAPIPHAEAILFATYATLRSPAREGKISRLEQIVGWLAGGTDDAARHVFAGVVVFDEAHAMANAAGGTGSRGAVKPSQQGRAGLRLQNALPDARIVYGSATGASTLQGLAYATRLGLWATIDTPFENRARFIQAMEAGGVAAMEVVARDLKALGLYQARVLSYDGIEVDILEHRLTPEQRRIYDSYADAFKIIHRNIREALQATGIEDEDGTRNRNAKSAAMSAFEGAKQRFFGHLLTSMKCPSTVRAIERDLEEGRSAVIQLVSTGEALMERRIAEIPASEWDDLSIDLTPREYVLDFLEHAFPVQLQEAFEDDEGNLLARPVFDENGHAVICQEALQRRDALIQKLAALPPVTSALDQIMHHFGHDAVAEVTGRSRRVLRMLDARGSRLSLRSRPGSANLAETAAFMDGDKRILVFSMAGGTGRSYHADLGCGNTERRIHYLLEPGWRADQAIQGLGRTHRTHQASAPLFRPVATDVKGERRFIATIARRLDSLGAITRGQRDSQTAMGGDDTALFRESDNLESPYARAALRQFYGALWRGRIEGWSLGDFEEATGLKLTHEGNLKEELPPMSQFLNRLLALPIDEQNQLFAALETRIDANIAAAIEAGVFNRGVETVRADSLTIADRETVFVHPTTGAETEIAEIVKRDPLIPLSADDALAAHRRGSDKAPELVVNAQSDRAALVMPDASRMLDDGGVETRFRLIRPREPETIASKALAASNWAPADEPTWRNLWDAEIASLPSHTETRFWLVAGLLLPIWDRLPEKNLRVRRVTADDGEQLIGRILLAGEVRDVRAAFGLDGGPALSAEELRDEIMVRGQTVRLANGWKITRRRHMNAERIEIEGPTDRDLAILKRAGCTTEIVAWAHPGVRSHRRRPATGDGTLARPPTPPDPPRSAPSRLVWRNHLCPIPTNYRTTRSTLSAPPTISRTRSSRSASSSRTCRATCPPPWSPSPSVTPRTFATSSTGAWAWTAHSGQPWSPLPCAPANLPPTCTNPFRPSLPTLVVFIFPRAQIHRFRLVNHGPPPVVLAKPRRVLRKTPFKDRAPCPRNPGPPPAPPETSRSAAPRNATPTRSGTAPGRFPASRPGSANPGSSSRPFPSPPPVHTPTYPPRPQAEQPRHQSELPATDPPPGMAA